jgi:hypothetical protein
MLCFDSIHLVFRMVLLLFVTLCTTFMYYVYVLLLFVTLCTMFMLLRGIIQNLVIAQVSQSIFLYAVVSFCGSFVADGQCVCFWREDMHFSVYRVICLNSNLNSGQFIYMCCEISDLQIVHTHEFHAA